jgi:hypothetical protein
MFIFLPSSFHGKRLNRGSFKAGRRSAPWEGVESKLGFHAFLSAGFVGNFVGLHIFSKFFG